MTGPCPPLDSDDGPGPVFTELSAALFASVARHLLAVAASHRVGKRISFRSPPRQPRVSRALRRNEDGSVVVSVTIRGRSAHAVAADMIDGIMHVADLGHDEPVFSAMWEKAAELLDPLLDAGPPPGSSRRVE